MRLPMMRLTTLVLTAVTLATVVLITGCGSLGGNTTTVSATPTPTPIVVDGVTYMTVTDAMFGFSIDIPTGMRKVNVEALPSTGGDVVTWSGTVPTSSDTIGVGYGGASTGLYPNECPQGLPEATAVPVGHGITGYETNNLTLPSTPPPGGQGTPPSITVTFLSQGVVINFGLSATSPYGYAAFMQRYGSIWQHMLASFKPGSYVNATPLCGA